MGTKRIRMLLTSSYEKNNFNEIFESLIKEVKPEFIVEFGIGNGYSLESFIKHSDPECDVMAFDLFEDYQFNRPSEEFIRDKFHGEKVIIDKADFYECVDWFNFGEVDILHIDISNDGDVYEFAIKNYLEKIAPKGMMILEGGSEERDNVWWMEKFNKRKINPYIKELSYTHNVTLIQKFPSLTIIRK